jgi:hypothetical protein
MERRFTYATKFIFTGVRSSVQRPMSCKQASSLYIKMGGEVESAALRYNMVKANPASPPSTKELL